MRRRISGSPIFARSRRRSANERDRTKGSHHIYVHPDADRPLNIQNAGGKAKAYQVRQFLRDIEEFHLNLQEKS
jgi:hypothetical protein